MKDTQDDLLRLDWEATERRAAQGDASYIGELGSLLSDRHAAAVEQVREYERGLAHVVRVLALTPGRENVVQLVRLLNEQRTGAEHPGLRPRFIASLLAEGQSVADLATVFDRSGRDRLDELRSCLFHELLLRGVDTDAFRQRRYRPLGRPGPHNLGWLPVHQRDFEVGVDFPSRSLRGEAGGVAIGFPAEGRADPSTPRTVERAALRDVATADVHKAIVSAVAAGGWGGAGAWVFLLDDAVEPRRVPTLLPTLPMACVEGLGPTGRFEIAVRPLNEIWCLLFATASMGGMYGLAACGAYGRLAAWQSMAGLSGAPADASADEVEHEARRTTWFHFDCDASWFHNEIYDYGIAALSPDGRRIAVLAGTDTD
ncbi:DUF6183 family protein [Streptacidiphilus sp. MAP5-3]|uniref:DUF6183 family protein n=1 Tax=unclassified Streptacidiphilus TaxID=2643834 RepID=UPI003517133F